ncbi:MAG: YjbH domain-containing protein [Acetobacteraceae bacterium]|nr:YjbH domain-containing protein [Acetobacteraceae bacterium]
MPNARMRPDGVVETGVALRRQRSFWFVNFQALPFLETTFRLTDRLNGTTGRGNTTDRAFDLKLQLWTENAWRPALAVGVQDVIGTGLYAGEYVVASKRFWSVDVTLGMGWGRLGTGADVRNPFGLASDRFLVRPRSVGVGGVPALGGLFRGRDAAVFGGLEWSLPSIPTPFGDIEGLRAKVEWSGDALRDERGGWPARTMNLRGRAASRVNAALQWQPNEHVDVGLSFVHGTDVLLRASLRLDPWAPPELVPRQPPPRMVPRPTPVAETGGAAPDPSVGFDWRRQLLQAASGVGGTVRLGRDEEVEGEAERNAAVARRLFPALRDAGFIPVALDIQGEEARITVSGGRYRTLAQTASRVMRAAQPHLPAEVERLRLVWERDGATVARLILLREAFEGAARGQGSAEEIFAGAQLLPATPERGAAEARGPAVRLDWGIEPRLSLQVGDPQASIRWQGGVAAGVRLSLPYGLALAGSVQQAIAGNLDRGLPSDSLLPRVRSDYARYARDGRTSIPALYAEGIWNLAPDWHARVTAGLLEPMFSGVAGEVLWRPQGSRLALGLDLAWVAQRDYRGGFGVLGYNVVTGHASLYYDLPWWNLYTVLRAGRYLAGDWGATIEAGRRFPSGIEVGGFATFTNVPFRTFGEGSFDKGIFVRVPFDVFGLDTRSRASLNIRPVQRDGGQRLAVDNPLWELTRDGRASALSAGFQGFMR